MIALTFDDGVNDPYTRQILHILHEYHAKATFFVMGKWADLRPDILADVRAEGHEVGNHTYSHPQLGQLDQMQGMLEIAAGGSAIGGSRHFRAPFGDVPNWLTDHVGWDVHGGDWALQDVDAICQPIFSHLDSAKWNSIVLLHDGYYKRFGEDRSATVEATRKILMRYPKERFVTISELEN